MNPNETKLYIAYGSNLNTEQMHHRCPAAVIAGKSELVGFRVNFRGSPRYGFATVERDENSTVPVLLWSITAKDERALDRYESCPTYYRKETMSVELDGEMVEGMIYIMNSGHALNRPSEAYCSIVRHGYEENGFNTAILTAFVQNNGGTDNQPAKLITPKLKEQILAIRDSGVTNMLDTRAVQYYANQREFYELVCFIEDHRREYVSFIFNGDGED